MNALIATDLDRTMIYSRSAVTNAGRADSRPPSPGRAELPSAGRAELSSAGRAESRFQTERSKPPVCVEIYNDAPLSFMTAPAVDALTALAAHTNVVPVTTRTRAQFERISLPGGPFRYAVVSNGGRILCDGDDDALWRARLHERVSERSAPLADLHADLLSRIDDSWVQSTRIADDLFVYLVVDPDRQPPDFVPSWREWCAPRGWTVSQQGRKIYAMPVAVTKSSAIAEVRRRLVEEGVLPTDAPVLAAGDGRLDADLLEFADHAIRPRHGELHDAGWTIPGLKVTRVAGAAAAEEILAWFAARAFAAPAPPVSTDPVSDPAFAEK
ncbi:HAD family hydrolase [Gordonia sp. (in: high G+C Gram-positive bacteria)]|uniref:HAD family hydrolase n=1 Tax=Gordonia sp. (in: high G+C Gram-positive bacteria) TaxID=84139 RepID=UPI003F97C4FE